MAKNDKLKDVTPWVADERGNVRVARLALTVIAAVVCLALLVGVPFYVSALYLGSDVPLIIAGCAVVVGLVLAAISIYLKRQN